METKDYININMEKLNKLKGSIYLSLNSSNDLDNVEKQLIKDISENIIEIVKETVNYSLNDVNTVLQKAISLRYLLETLITTSLLVKEPEYKYIIYLAFYKKQIDAQTNIIKELEKESERLLEWNEKKYAENQKLYDQYKVETRLSKKDKENIDNFHEFLNTEFTIFADFSKLQQFDYYGLHCYIDNYIIPIYQKGICDLEKKQNEILKKLVKNEKFKSLFPDVNGQVSKVKKKVKDNKGKNGNPRSWVAKSDEVGLKEEYDFIYSYTSDLSHFAAYSLYSPSTTSEEEEEMMLKRINIYLIKIIENLKLFINENEIIASFVEWTEVIILD